MTPIILLPAIGQIVGQTNLDILSGLVEGKREIKPVKLCLKKLPVQKGW